jgi:hypothetical protein
MCRPAALAAFVVLAVVVLLVAAFPAVPMAAF